MNLKWINVYLLINQNEADETQTFPKYYKIFKCLSFLKIRNSMLHSKIHTPTYKVKQVEPLPELFLIFYFALVLIFKFCAQKLAKLRNLHLGLVAYQAGADPGYHSIKTRRHEEYKFLPLPRWSVGC